MFRFPILVWSTFSWVRESGSGYWFDLHSVGSENPDLDPGRQNDTGKPKRKKMSCICVRKRALWMAPGVLRENFLTFLFFWVLIVCLDPNLQHRNNMTVTVILLWWRRGSFKIFFFIFNGWCHTAMPNARQLLMRFIFCRSVLFAKNQFAAFSYTVDTVRGSDSDPNLLNPDPNPSDLGSGSGYLMTKI